MKAIFHIRVLVFCAMLFSSVFMGTHVQADPQYIGNQLDWSWTTQNWTATDKPYVEAREAIGSRYKLNTLREVELTQFKKASFAKPDDALVRFKWAYYAYCMALREPSLSLGSAKLSGVEQAFRFNPSPGSYQYTRLRFLVLSYLTQSGPQLKKLGERLLLRDAKDTSVKYVQVTHLNNGDASNQAQALKYAQQLVKEQPQTPAMYVLVAFLYRNRWLGTHSKSDANAAIANYKRYIALGKLSSEQRSEVEENIQELQKG